jgi:hypothetical protein
MNKQNPLFLLLLVIVVQACGLSSSTVEDQSSSEPNFQATEKKITDVVHQNLIPLYLEGKARILYSSPQENERLTVEFSANADVCFMRFKNSIGIEAIHLWVDADSITEYNQIDKTLIRMAKHDFATSFSSGLVPFHLFDVFFPERLFSTETQVWENENQWKFKDVLFAIEGVASKKNLVFTQLSANDQVQAFTQIDYSEHAALKKGRFIARKMAMSIKSTSTRILIGITEFKESDEAKEIDITLPKNVSLERL